MTDLRTLRKALGLTQAELASILGTTRQTICEQERGRTPISRERMLAVRYLSEHPEELDRLSHPALSPDEIVGSIDLGDMELRDGDTITITARRPTGDER